MEVDAFLADSVAGADGKLFVQGAGWNIIHVAGVPATHDRIGLGLVISVPYTATNQAHSFEIVLEDEDGSILPIGDAPPGSMPPDDKLRRIVGNFNVGRPATIVQGDDQVVVTGLNINGLKFDRAGLYRFVVSIDGTPVKKLPFRISLILAPTILTR